MNIVDSLRLSNEYLYDLSSLLPSKMSSLGDNDE